MDKIARGWLLITLAFSFTLLDSAVLANHVEPGSAKKAQFSLVNGYSKCDSPNTATQSTSTGQPACTPPIQNGVLLCALSATGSGKLTALLIGSVETNNEDIKLGVVAKGIEQCEGQQLCISLSFRATTDDCPEGSCTMTDVDHFTLAPPEGCCVITNGKCKIKTTLLTSLPGFVVPGKNTGMEILHCGLQGPNPLFGSEISCGVLLK